MPIKLPFAVRPLALGTIVTGNSLSNRPASNLNLLDYVGMTWKTSGAANVWIRGDFGSARQVDFISMVGANALVGTDIRVRLGTTQAEVDGSAPYDSTALDYISPSIAREDGLYSSHLEIGSPVSCRWWRIDITSHTGDFEASGLVLGKKITPARFYEKDFEFGIEDLGDIEFSRNGVVGKTAGRVLRTLQFRLAWLTESEFETSFRPMIEALAMRGISFWCFDPEPNAYRQAKSFLGYFGRAPFARGGVMPKTYTQDYVIQSLV